MTSSSRSLPIRSLDGEAEEQDDGLAKYDGECEVKQNHQENYDTTMDVPEGRPVNHTDALFVLESITWPLCTTRNNVIPDGLSSTKAFPLGIVNAYRRGLMTN